MSDPFSKDTLFDDIDNLDSNPDIAAALGNMVVSWAFAESALSHTLSVVTGLEINRAMLAYYRIPTYESRTKFILNLAESWGAESFDKDAIAKCINGLSRLSKSRNKWIHGTWGKGQTTKLIVTFHLREQEPANIRQQVKAVDISNHNRAVRAKSHELFHLIRRVP